jgi:hypothetical protein
MGSGRIAQRSSAGAKAVHAGKAVAADAVAPKAALGITEVPPMSSQKTASFVSDRQQSVYSLCARRLAAGAELSSRTVCGKRSWQQDSKDEQHHGCCHS